MYVIHDGITAVWCRKTLALSGDGSGINKRYRAYCPLAQRRFIEMLSVQFTESTWISPYSAMVSASHQPLQLQTAKRVGFAIPETIITIDLVLDTAGTYWFFGKQHYRSLGLHARRHQPTD